MADDEAERAFFAAQAQSTDQANFDSAAEDNPDSEDDYDPMQTVTHQYADAAPSAYSHGQPSQHFTPQHSQETLGTLRRTQSASVDNNTDPSTPTLNHPLTSVQSSSLESRGHSESEESGQQEIPKEEEAETKQEEEVSEEAEEEDDGGDEAEYEPPAALSHVQEMASVSADIPQRFVSENMNETVSSFDVPQQQTVSNKITPHDVPISSSSFPPSNVGIASQSVSMSTKDVLQNGPNTWSPMPSAEPGKSPTPAAPGTTSAPASATASITAAAAAPRGRLPHDRVGILEDRIQADPRGDTEAWLELISEYRNRNKIESARQVFERFFKVFPTSAEQWIAFANLELELNELYQTERIFQRSLLTIPDVRLWSLYLDYIRRRHNLTTDTTGEARKTISSAYDFALQNIGVDKDSGPIWMDYIQFTQSGPGNIGGSGWQDQQKMDSLRKAYQRAICIPTQAINSLWKDYDQFEMGLNKLTGRKFLQEKSPLYMTARSSYTELQNITRDLIRTTLPRLPPAPGFDGHTEYVNQIEIWRRWIKWEKDDPLVLKDEDPTSYKARVLYVYKQALMALRFLPEIWFEAADFSLRNGMESEGNEFLKQGIEANPESCLLAFKLGDRLESTSESEQDPKKRGAKVREPYDKLLDALYDLITKARAKEAEDITRVEERYAQQQDTSTRAEEEDEEDAESEHAKAKEAAKTAEINLLKKQHAAHIGILSRTVSFAWIALMRAMRRIQGKGKPGEVPGSRQIFADARKRGRITSDVYIASALMEYHCYKDPAATKIFERGAKLFPDDEVFALEYLKHLIDINDITNARAVFETTVRRLTSNPETAGKAKPIFAFLHEYESRYGDLVQIINLENRMAELYPEDPTLQQFSHRYSIPAFDPTAFKPIISPTQLRRPKSTTATTTTTTTTTYGKPSSSSRQGSPAPRYISPPVHSPKRAYPTDDYDDEYSNRPRKFIRAESPLKGAAGRRMDQQKRAHQQQERQQQLSNGSSGQTRGGLQHQQPPPPSQLPPASPLPKEIINLLSIIPPASTYESIRFKPDKLVELLRQTELPQSMVYGRAPPPPPPSGSSRSQYQGGWNYS